MLTFPYITNHQTVTNFANSDSDVIALADRGGRGELSEIHAQRLQELMGFRTPTVATDGF